MKFTPWVNIKPMQSQFCPWGVLTKRISAKGTSEFPFVAPQTFICCPILLPQFVERLPKGAEILNSDPEGVGILDYCPRKWF